MEARRVAPTKGASLAKDEPDIEWEIVGYQDNEGDRYDWEPWDVDVDRGEVDGVLVHSWDAGDPDSGEWHWVYQTNWDDWEDIYATIADVLDMYAMEAG